MTASPASSGPARPASRNDALMVAAVAAALLILKGYAFGVSGSMALLASLTVTTLELAAALATLVPATGLISARGRMSLDHASEGGASEGGAGGGRWARISAVLAVVAGLVIGLLAVQRLVEPRSILTGDWALGAAMAGLLATLLLVWRRSERMDVRGLGELGPDVAVLAGVTAGAFLAAPALDAAAALAVSAWLVWGGVETLNETPGLASAAQATKQATEAGRPVDAPVDPDILARLRALALSDPRILMVRDLEAHRAGGVLSVRLRALMKPGSSLKTARAAADGAEARVRDAFPDAVVRVEPEPAQTGGSTGVPETE